MTNHFFPRLLTALIFVNVAFPNAFAADQKGIFDGRPWNISSGNASVMFIQASPIGAAPRPNFLEEPPSLQQLKSMHDAGLVAFEDYVAWGAVEREPGKWDWTQHDRMEKAMHAAGLKYVVYDWVHFPPVWLRNSANCTLMRCVEHGEQTNYLSIFDPGTIQWFDHFYQQLHEHFGDRIDDVYACIEGPYGEGNYPQLVTSWVNMGHCHQGYWCGDEYAIRAFQSAMRRKYEQIAALNRAWGTNLASFDAVLPPHELSDEKFKPAPSAFPSPQDKRRWLDFITWYHQAIIDFAEQSVKTVLKYWPADKVRLKPGGTARGVNPISWGTYSPGYAKMARPYGIELQPADSSGAIFGDKWMATAYQFYGVKLGTEPAYSLDARTFVRRVFSDASCGASQFFTYEFEQHISDMQHYVHLYTGHAGETEVAVYCPTTLYRLGADLHTTITAGYPLRSLCDFDVLDELLIADGALTVPRYRALVIFEGDIIDQPILDRFDRFLKAGGKIIFAGSGEIHNVEGKPWPGEANLTRSTAYGPKTGWLHALATHLAGLKGVDSARDGLWTTHRGAQTILCNPTGKRIRRTIDGREIEVAPNSIWESPGLHSPS